MANTPQGTTPTHMEDVAQFLDLCTDNTVKVVGNTLTVTPPGIHYIGCINPGVLPKWYVTLDTTEPYGSSTAQRAGLLRSTNEGTYNVSLITWRQHARMAGLWLRTHVPYATCYNTEQLLAIADETCGVPSPQHVDRTPPTRKPLPRPVLKQEITMLDIKVGNHVSHESRKGKVVRVFPPGHTFTYSMDGETLETWAIETSMLGVRFPLGDKLLRISEVRVIPTLKQQDHYEWAFKLGTLCSPGTPTPNWWAAFPKQGGAFYQPGVDSLSTLEKLFVLGTMCKPGTSLEKVVEASNLVPKHTIQKMVESGCVTGTTLCCVGDLL